ncbi:uncharacterized protein LOC113226076 [Hyposmocoma kahamanoa]|uniref:uncharacterized protein LOC113226076 n=1 Tax=Hyposmocoma kahamanoa TaxID=1477025 RepID=UPI000E6D9D27|nr:uncharacterized protein LOC113226076 [Hyposmocoma kahamanoa]
MSSLIFCRCCLLRPPDKDLKTAYRRLDKIEIYGDMLKECFEIHISIESTECGICEVCITRLRDACDFKMQVQQCQKELQRQAVVKDEDTAHVKEEIEETDDSVAVTGNRQKALNRSRTRNPLVKNATGVIGVVLYVEVKKNIGLENESFIRSTIEWIARKLIELGGELSKFNEALKKAGFSVHISRIE